MPLGASTGKLSSAELTQLEEKVNTWKKLKVGREVVKKVGKETVEGIVFSVENDFFKGPKATWTSTYLILWDKAGLNRKKKRPLENLLPGENGVEQQVLSGEQLGDDQIITLRAAFSHPDLMLPIKLLQEHGWRYKSVPAAQQRLLLEWTPWDEHAARYKRHKDLGNEFLAKMAADPQQQLDQAAPGRGPRRDAPSGRNRPATVASPAKKRAKVSQTTVKQKREEPLTDEGSEVEDEGDGAMPDAVSGSSGGFADAREDALPAEEDALADFTPTGRPPPEITPRRQPAGQQPAAAVGASVPGSKANGLAHGGGGVAAVGAAAATKAAGTPPGGKRGAAGGRDKRSGGTVAAQLPLPMSDDEEAGPEALNDMVPLPPGSEPPAVPTRLTLSEGDKLVQEYKDQLFASDEEFEPQHIVAQRPAGAPREYLVKWRNYELDPGDWSAYKDLAETKALDAWEKERPPPQGAGKPPPPLPKSAAKGSAKRKRKR